MGEGKGKQKGEEKEGRRSTGKIVTNIWSL